MSSSYVWFVFSRQCYSTLIEQGQLLNIACLKLVLSRLLSLAVIVGSCVLKVPQIIEILQARAVRRDTGLAPSMYWLESVG